MKDATTHEATVTVGLDLGDSYCQICVLDARGAIVEEGRVATRPEALEHRFLGPACRIVLEAGTHSPWVSRLLGELGHEVLVANPRKLRLIYENESKSDRVDAEYLARVGRLDPALLCPLRHRSASTQADLALLRTRNALVESRTRLINHTRGTVKSLGYRLPSCGGQAFAREAERHLPAELAPALGPALATIAAITEQISTLERTLKARAKAEYPDLPLLTQVSGVGTLTALAFMLIVESPTRFAKSRVVGSYVGLRPRRAESGSLSPQLGITKAGDRQLRFLLVQSAQYMLGPFGPDSDLRRWGLALAARGGKNGRKRAVVAVARKLAVLLLHLWQTGEVYEPLHHAAAGSGDPVAA
jgi:transposase